VCGGCELLFFCPWKGCFNMKIGDESWLGGCGIETTSNRRGSGNSDTLVGQPHTTLNCDCENSNEIQHIM